jgi:prepilin-type processing-associated H-X9-DG protein
VQKAREAASRIRCSNNLKQIALAMHNYEFNMNSFPPSRLGQGYATWAVLILPYIEQDNLYRQWNLGLTYYQQNTTAQRSAVPIYFCPSRRVANSAPMWSISGDIPSSATLGSGSQNVPGALGDYAASIDRSGYDYPTTSQPSMTAAFQMGSGTRFADFTDGTSNTILMGEKQVPQGNLGVGWWDCSIYNGDYYQCSCRAASRAFPLTTNPQDTAWKFGSMHMQVVMFAFADGHVQSIPETIDPTTYELLGMRNDGQVIPPW